MTASTPRPCDCAACRVVRVDPAMRWSHGDICCFCHGDAPCRKCREANDAAIAAARGAGVAVCSGDAEGDGYPGSRFFHKSNAKCPGHDGGAS